MQQLQHIINNQMHNVGRANAMNCVRCPELPQVALMMLQRFRATVVTGWQIGPSEKMGWQK